MINPTTTTTTLHSLPGAVSQADRSKKNRYNTVKHEGNREHYSSATMSSLAFGASEEAADALYAGFTTHNTSLSHHGNC